MKTLTKQQTALFETERLTLERSMDLTAESLCAYGQSYRHWAIAYSGGKDSSATVTAVAHLIETGRVPQPESLTIIYADTRMELPPLHIAAMSVMGELARRGMRTRIVLPELDRRFFVYMFGRGVPPSHSGFRWCTGGLKVDPMTNALRTMRDTAGEKFLMLTGVRLGESAARDQRIALSCTKDGAECGQGYFQQSTPANVADTLAPIVHWRVCHVWDWLNFFAPDLGFGTRIVADAYGGDEAVEVNARTGCVGCPVAGKETALETILRKPEWSYLAPLRRLKPLYEELSLPRHRLRRDSNTCGPLVMSARRHGLEQVLSIQAAVNQGAELAGKPPLNLLNEEEHDRINALIAADTWPTGWTGRERGGADDLEVQDGDNLLAVQLTRGGGRQVRLALAMEDTL